MSNRLTKGSQAPDFELTADDGSQVSFDADETRALFAWLDRLGGTNLQRLAAPEEEAAE